MKTGEIMKVTDYNRIGLSKWENDFTNHNDPFTKPQLAFYVFTDRFGNYKQYGYVGKYKKGVVWRKTKKEVREELIKEGAL